MYNVLIVFTVLSGLAAILDIILALRCSQKRQPGAKQLAEMCAASAGTTIFYTVSIYPVSYRMVSLFSSLYFVSIDMLLLFLLGFIARFIGMNMEKRTIRSISWVFKIWVGLDAAVLFFNVFREVAVHYVDCCTVFARYRYEKFLLYDAHLMLSYFMAALVLLLLIQRFLTVPSEYKYRYLFVIVGMMGVVIVNAGFLFWSGSGVLSRIDWSILGYVGATFVLYWTSYQYATHGMLNRFKSVIFENIDQGFVLFDFDDQFIMANDKARVLVKNIDFEQTRSMNDFIQKLGLGITEEKKDVSCSLQCEVENQFLRCDYSAIENRRHQKLGHLFILTNASQETDLMTGFQNLENFHLMVKDGSDRFPQPTAAVVIDINNLGVYNSRFGRSEGDKKIRALATKMRDNFPQGTYFVRGQDAQLIAICAGKTEQTVKEYLTPFDSDVEYAVAATSADQPDLYQTVRSAMDALGYKKLMDSSSAHYELINSLIQALEQCDPDTRAHVQRTQKLGAELGRRIGLSDYEQSQLSLLCILHDIGKIAIPLEILNKPGSLNSEEWKIMRSHVQKGYDITNSSKDLSAISDMILHHHERWDGKGYPDGLDKEAIPLLSRIISVVDAYDAMVNDRVYRRGLSVKEALEELRRGAGKQFDPALVTEFVKIVNEQTDTGADRNGEQGAETVAEETTDRAAERNTNPPGEYNENVKQNARLHEVQCTQFFVSESMQLLSVDSYFEHITGYKQEEVANFTDLIPEEDQTLWLLYFNTKTGGKETFMLEHYLLRKDGRLAYVSSTARRRFNAASKTNQISVVMIDSEETAILGKLREEEKSKNALRMQRWEDRYRKDSLTGLLAHDSYANDVEEHLLRKDDIVMMIMMDVDHFKEFNDTYGHRKGDEFLIAAAGALKNAIRSTDLAGRMGGDEFSAALFFRKDIPVSDIEKTAKAVFERVSEEVRTFSEGASVSMGAAVTGPDVNDFTELYEKADEQLYISKNAGRGRLSTGIGNME